MDILRIVIVIFLLLEAMNVLTLYFAPSSKLANGVGVFNAWEKSKQDPEVHQLVAYLVNWVAGTKLIFIMLLIVILLTANEQTLLYTHLAMVVSVASFFWRLFPIIRKLDQEGHISPKGYSKALGWMILAFILVFAGALLYGLVTMP
jgi:hypothetical protein